jgi:hypothetical protein
MSYSRRELYAAGEPLGECITRLRVDGRVLCGGGGGGGTTQATTYTSNIPEYAEKPFMDLVGQASALSKTPYQAYTGDRIAQYTPLQQNAFNLAGNMQVSPYLQQAAGMAGAGGQYQPGQFGFNNVSGANVSAPMMGQTGNVSGANVSGVNMNAAQSGYRPNLQAFQMQGPANVSTQSFLSGNTAQNFMSPYMQNVVDATKREAYRDDDVMRQGRQAQAVNAGAFGGSRQAIMEAEAQRNLGTRMADIQTTGLQSAFDRAQNQFNTEQQNRLQANLANQQMQFGTNSQNLSARLGVQELGAGQQFQTAMANLSNQQQAAVQNQAAQMQARGMSAENAMRAALANQQVQYNTNVQNQAALLQARGMTAENAMRAALANQQAGLQTQQMGEQSRQFGADLGMQGAGLLGQLGQSQFSQLSDIIGMQNQMGGDQQKLIQDILSQQYGDFLAQQNYPYQQLGFLADVLRGAPGSTRTVYQPTAQPSSFQTVAGLGSLFAGMGGMKKGGEVKKPKAGLAELALSKM